MPGRVYREFVSPGRDGLKFLRFGLVSLPSGSEQVIVGTPEELALVIMGGKCDITCLGFKWAGLGDRSTPFDGKASAAYIPAGIGFTIAAQTPLLIALAAAPGSPGGIPQVVHPNDVEVSTSGMGNFRREVHTIIGPNISARRLFFGEVFGPEGNWITYPPHKHDTTSEREANLEEVRYYLSLPAGGFGFERVYAADGSFDHVKVVEDGSVSAIPCGYHTAASAPGYQFYYLWAMAGPVRDWKTVDDPDHS
jgi:5-deoxy-glucuronate isomerase